MPGNGSEPPDLILLQQFYEQIPSKTDTIFATSIKKVLSYFGSLIKDDLLLKAKTKYNVSEMDLFTNYYLVEKCITDFFGSTACKTILDEILQEISRFRGEYSAKSLESILKKMKLDDLNTFLKNLNGHEHVLFLWENKENVDMILEKCLSDKNNHVICFSRDKSLVEHDLVLFSDLFANKDPISVETEMINKIHSTNHTQQPTWIIADDCTAWFESNHKEQFIQFEESLNSYFEKNNVIGICGFDITKIDDNDFKRIVPCFHYVVLEPSGSIYKRK